MDSKNVSSNYNKRVHMVGIISSLLIVVSLIIVPLGAQIFYGQKVEWGMTLKAMLGVLMVYGPVAVIEFMTYLPIIGAGGQYLSFTTGNVMNMKVPAAASGRKIAEVESGTDEGDVISMISIAVSSITTTVIVFIGMVIGAQLLPILQSDLLSPAFNNVMPAIMGALGLPIIFNNLKMASVPVALSAILTLYLGYQAFMAQQGARMILFLVVSLLWAYILFRKNQSKSKESE